MSPLLEGERHPPAPFAGAAFRPGRLLASLAVALVALPVLALAVAAAQGSGDLWPHLARHVLPGAVMETALLLAGVGAVVVGVGTGTAWLVSLYRFPGRRLLSAALVLPLALPAYVSAYAWLDVVHPAGPVQSALRGLLGLPRPLPLPEIRSLPGCVLVMGSVLYPYVYLAARAAFLTQGAELLRAGRGLGAGGWRLFRAVGLPLARPAVAAGAALALLDALNDVGAATFLGVQTLTVSVYVTWITRSSLAGAAQIALLLLFLVAAVLALEGWARGRAGATRAVRDAAAPEPRRLGPVPGALAALACLLPVLSGFAIPAAYLLWSAARRVAEFGLPPALGAWVANSALLAALATLLVLPAGPLRAAGARGEALPGRRDATGQALLRAGMLGYALPGGIAAVGLITAFGALDSWTEGLPGRIPALSGTLAAIVAAYFVRFLAIPAGGLDAAFARIPPQMDLSARSMGAGRGRILARLHLPLLRPALLAAALLLRPVDRETLATALYAEASRGTYEEGAVAALALILVGLPVIALLLAGSKDRTR